MKYISDEVLNKYIDGELDPQEQKDINRLLMNDNDLKKRLKVLKRIDNYLKKITVDELPDEFTLKVMKSISHKYQVPREQKLFITIIVSFISVLFLSIMGYLIINIAGEVSYAISSGTGKAVSNYSQSIIQSLVTIFSGLNISIFGSLLSIILLISGYFFLEMLKQSKTNLSS